MKNTKHVQKGFTLVELMVVIGIIALMSAIIFAAVGQARENTREKKRVADLANIEFALTLTNEKDKRYPDFASGVEIGVGDAIDDVIKLYNGNAYKDPKSSGTRGDSYGYWYDSNFTCYATGQTVLYIKTMEQSKNANFTEVCTHPDAGGEGAGSSSYVVLLGQQLARTQSAPPPALPDPDPDPVTDPGSGSGSGTPPTMNACTPESNIADSGKKWWGDWPSPPVQHEKTWRTSSMFQKNSHRCCNGDVKVRIKQGIFISYPSYPVCR